MFKIFCLFNLFYVIIKYVGRISGRDIDKKGWLIFAEVVFVFLIVFFTLLSKHNNQSN